MAESDAQSPCLKHNANWNKRLYWALNKLYDNLIPRKYQKRVGGLLCTCYRRANLPPRNDPFLTVSRDELYQAASSIDVFILTNNRHENIEVLKRLMQWFRDDGLLPAQGSLHQGPVPGQISGVYKLLYILKKCIHRDYTFLDPPLPLNARGEPEAKEKVLEFLIENCDHNLVGSIIGRSGNKLKPLLKMYKCHIKVDKVTMGDDQKIKVTVRKRSSSMETLERVKKAIEDMAKEVVQEENRYQEQRRRADEQHRKDFEELLHRTKEMSRTVTWNEILRALTGNVRHYSLTRAVGHDRLKTWFEEIQREWVDPESEGSSASSGSSSRAFDRPGPSIVHQNQFSDEEMEDTALKREPAGASGVSSNFANIASGPVPSTSGFRPESSPHMSAGASLMATASGSSSFKQPLSAAQEGRLNISERTSICLVHDRKWVPTYQFTLTRCYQQIKLEKKYGRAFSRFVCSCESSVPDCLRHFESEAQMKESFKRVIDNIENWPQEVQDIMSPLVSQLKKGREAETWHSLYRFVFLFDSMLQGRTDCLEQSYRLPYGPQDSNEGSIVCQPQEEEMDTSPSPGTSSAVVTSVRNTQNVAGVYRSEECYFHGKKKRASFQCVVNYLHDSAGFPRRYNMPFCRAVCICNEDGNSPPVYQSQNDLHEGCRNMREKLSKWRGSSSVTIKPLITLLEQYLNRERELERGFQKFVFFFNCVYKRDFVQFEEKK